MEEKIILYVAGNPDAYPLEYYDSETQSYQGVIPQLLRDFSSQSRYEVLYYQADGADHRTHLAENLQVDILSGYKQGEETPKNTQAITLFYTTQDETQTAYQLLLTAAAPDTLKAELETFLHSVSQAQISGQIIDAAAAPRQNTSWYWAVGALSLTVVLLAAVLVLLVRRYRKKLKKAQQDLELDAVTGLGNLAYFSRYAKQLIHDQNRILYSLVYFHVDTDRLRRLAGSAETEEFLRYCAVVLLEHTGDGDLLAKVSDHGFALLRRTGSIAQTEMWLSPICSQLHAYTQKYAKPFQVHVTAGVYPLKAGDRDLNTLIFNACQGAYLARRQQKDYVICSDEMLRQLAEEKQLQAEIDRALDRQEFQLYIQFYVDVQSYRIVGGEALSRWNHPQKGLLTPGLFVPLMEQENKISKLDYYCLQKVCQFLQDLAESGVETFFISCNFSRATFAAADFAENCKSIINAFRFPRELLIFEITESAAVHNLNQIQQNIVALKAYGIRIALDDFGEGFTSFYDLQKYPVDGIKLDKGLIDNALTESGGAILQAMIQVGHALGVTILAEGVETEEQVQVLQTMHCDVIQGFRFHFPLPDWEAKSKISEQFAL